MSEQPNPPPENQPSAPPTNTPEARNPDGTLKPELSAPTPSPTPEAPDSSPKSNEPTSKEPPKSAEGPPEKYSEFKVPDGFELNPEVADKAGALFKDLGLSQDAAQRLVDFYAEQQRAVAEAPFAEYERVRQSWRDETAKSDLGDGAGDLKPEVKANVDRVFQYISGTKDGPALVLSFKQIMDITGVGDHPAFVRALSLLGTSLAEGRAVTPGSPAPVRAPNSGPTSAAKALYPNLP